jgi:hypothetical protein
MDDKIMPFRQPLVTATGIILGFLLNFAATFVKADSASTDIMAYVTGICVLMGIISLIIVLWRALNMRYPSEKVEGYYYKTLQLFIFGISVSFTGVMFEMAANFMAG